MRVGMNTWKQMHTFSIALLVRSPLDPLLPLLALGINTFFSYAILDAAKAGPGIIALLASFLTVGASVLDLSALGAGWLCGKHAGWEWIHVHGHARVGDGMHRHGRLNGIGRAGGGVVIVVVVLVAFLSPVLSMYVVSPSRLHPFSSQAPPTLPQDLHQSPRSTPRPQSPYRCPPATTIRCFYKAKRLPGPSKGERREWGQCSPR